MSRMILIVLILSLLLLAYPAWRLGGWLGLSMTASLAVAVPFFLSQFLVRFAMRGRTGKLAYAVRQTADLYLGLSMFLFLQVLLAEILLLFFELPRPYVALAIISVTMLLAIWGVAKAWQPQVVTIALQSAKLVRPVRFVQISDVHIGSRTSRYLETIIQAVVDLQPDFLCITGDFIDRPRIGIDKLRSLQNFSKPIYYCTGNHEYYEDLDDIIRRLTSLGVEVLRNRAVVADGLQIIGIDDHSDPQQVAKVLPTIGVRNDLYSILLYHRPNGLADAHHNGIDLKLSGHTHNGQIKPFNLAVRKVFEYTRGLYQHNSTYLYVNQGTGTWGPTLRLGTRCEITLFELSV